MLRGVSFDQRQTEAHVQVTRAHVTRPTKAGVKHEKRRRQPTDEYGVLRGKADAAQEVSRLPENRRSDARVVLAAVRAVSSQAQRP